jgi:hypothetical protein
MQQLHQATENGNPLRIAFVAVHTRTTGPGSDYDTSVQGMWSSLAQHVYFRQYVQRISAWRIDAQRNDDLNTDITVPYIHQANVLQLIQSEIPDFDQNNGDVMVFCGPTNGQTRADPNVLQIAEGRESAFLHEFGHGFGGLGDEYNKPYTAQAIPQSPNLADSNSGTTCFDKWGDMIGLAVHPHPDLAHLQLSQQLVGCVQSNHSYINWSVPTNNYCIMYASNSLHPFCPVCYRHIEGLMRRYGSGEISFAFDQLPDGHNITSKRLLIGNEFLARGLALTIDPIHYAPTLTTQPAIVMAGGQNNIPSLTMAVQGNVDQLASRNIQMWFHWPVSRVRIKFRGASMPYDLVAYDSASNEVARAQQTAVFNQGSQDVEVSTQQPGITMVEFGEDRSVTLIERISYV